MIQRKTFRKLLPYSVPLPNLISVQINSYRWLFNEGIRELFDEINPIDDFTGKQFSLVFNDYQLEEPKYSEEMSRMKNLTYKAPLRCKVTFHNKVTNKKRESDVFLGDFPVMTDRGTFIINGIERVVVTQIVRSYGVIFTASTAGARKLFGAKFIPSRGAWLEFETSNRDVLFVKIDRKRKIPVTTFLRAFGGLEKNQVMEMFTDVDTDTDHRYIKSTLERDPAENLDEAYIEVYKRVRPGDLVTPESAKVFLETLFFDQKRYSLGRVGRFKLNRRLDLNPSTTKDARLLMVEDIVATIREIIRLNNNPTANADDVDHLKNRRVRAVGELIQSRLRVGLLRVERIIKDRMSVADPSTITPAQLINNRPIIAVLQEFFASSQLSQFMDQTNPLSELEHKRRIAATGPGGLTRERAGFEVRDVHNSHYGRICPIATPEGPNIGLVGQLASYAKINEYGFIETPYFQVEHKNNKVFVTNKIHYLDAFEEEKHIIAPASTPVTKAGQIDVEKAVVRMYGEPGTQPVSKIEYIDVSPKQIISVGTGLIPFIEHCEAVRASMGSNMVRQAVPLLRRQAPIIGTGIEHDALVNSGQVVIATELGEVKSVSANQIVVKDKRETVYKLQKFVRSNQGTAINQKPIVSVGQKIKKGQIIADSSASEEGELALGQNLLVAFMSFKGWNFEDAIVVSERLVREDLLTSIHIEKYSIEIRDTKLGPEIITRDIPNVGEESLADLDENGIIRIGAEVEAGDILVGKITPKGETELSAEEKLLRAIFGEKAKDVMDTSLRLPHGENGKVVEVKLFQKDQGDELSAGVYQMIEVSIAQLRKINVGDKLAGRHGNKGVIAKICPVEDMPYLPDGTPIDIILNPLGVVSRMNLGQILETHLGWAAQKLGYSVAAASFEGAPLEQIQAELVRAGLPADGKIQLYDGETSEPFDTKTTVGIIYMMKLIHLVDDKIHARSIGPYSMVTQQPLGGKAQFGGQRFGEMEVWALEAYGAAHTLQEMLTIKSDDVVGRSKSYEAIIKGELIQKPSIPASFYVLMRELQSLSLNVELLKQGHKLLGLTEVPKEKKVHPVTLEPSADAAVTEIFARQEALPPIAKPEEVVESL